MSLPTCSDHSPMFRPLIGQSPGLLGSDWSALVSLTRAHLLAPFTGVRGQFLVTLARFKSSSDPEPLSRNQIVFTLNN